MGSSFSCSCVDWSKSASKDMDKKSSPPRPPPPTMSTTEMNGTEISRLEVEQQTVDSVTGSKEEYFFDSKAYMDSDCDDDFFSVNGDYTPLGGSTPNNQVVINPIPTTPRLNKTLIDNVHLPSSENPSPFLSPRKKFSEFLSEPSSTEEQSVREEARNGELNGMSGKEQLKLNGDSHGMKKSSRTTTRCCLPMLSKRKTLDSTNPQRVEHSQDGGPDLDGKVLFETSPKGMGPGQEPCPPPR